jgi:hypothetical protein
MSAETVTRLLKKPFQVVALFLGFALVVVSSFRIDDITKFQLSAYANPILPAFAVGIALIIVAIVGFLLKERLLDGKTISRIKKTQTGYALKIRQANLSVSFGRIEDCNCSKSTCAIALPANEFFDKDCIEDTKSALGAYVQSAFPDQTDAIEQLISRHLEHLPSQEVEKKSGQFERSFGIGTSIYLDRPLQANRRIIVTSVTTKRPGEGLKAEAGFVFTAMKSTHQVMVDNRLRDLHLPLLGAGHGGLSKEVALLLLMFAVSDILHGPSSHHLDSINVVIFQENEKASPEIPRKVVRQALALAEYAARKWP